MILPGVLGTFELEENGHNTHPVTPNVSRQHLYWIKKHVICDDLFFNLNLQVFVYVLDKPLVLHMPVHWVSAVKSACNQVHSPVRCFESFLSLIIFATQQQQPVPLGQTPQTNHLKLICCIVLWCLKYKIYSWYINLNNHKKNRNSWVVVLL